jgi:dolichyl-phosphate beta-glucosyltransferase
MYLSIVIPAFNEARKIHRDLQAASHFLEAQRYSSEVLVVDDGSRDDTRAIVKRNLPKMKSAKVAYRLLDYGENHGKGYAVRYGIERAKGDSIAFVDSGLCVPFSYLEKGLELIENGADFAIASRRVPGTRILEAQPLYRQLGSKAFWLVMRTCMGVPFNDTQCGFKVYRREAAKQIFSRVHTDGFMFDVEALMVATRLGLKGAEFAVEWSNDRDTRYRPVGGTVRNFTELVRIRVRTFQGV